MDDADGGRSDGSREEVLKLGRVDDADSLDVLRDETLDALDADVTSGIPMVVIGDGDPGKTIIAVLLLQLQAPQQ